MFYIITTCLGAFLSVFTYILDKSDLGVNAVAADSSASDFKYNDKKLRLRWQNKKIRCKIYRFGKMQFSRISDCWPNESKSISSSPLSDNVERTGGDANMSAALSSDSVGVSLICSDLELIIAASLPLETEGMKE